jgi:Flp pilus assembly protein TadD
MKRHSEAISVLQLALELEPNARSAHYALGCAYRRQANFGAAVREFRKWQRMEADSDLALGSIGHVLAISGNKAGAARVLRELVEMAQRKYISPYSIAIVHIGLDNKDEAFNWMEKLYQDCNDWLIWLRVGPEFDPLRSDPRFDSLLRRVGIK